MANVLVKEASLQAIADAIREKNGSEDTYTPAEMAEAIEAISGGGGITPTGTVNISQNGTTDVTQYASASVSVPNSYSASDEGKVVSSGALVAQTSATYTANDTYDTTLINEVTVNVSGGGGYDVEDLSTRNYSGNISLTGTTIRQYAFESSKITGVSAPNATSVGQYAFANSTLESASFPLLAGLLATYAFRNTKLEEITANMFPLITRLDAYAFAAISTLISVVLPKLGVNDSTANGASLFSGCSKLEVADLGTIYNIPNNTFTNCAKLDTVIIRKTGTIAAMGNINAFQNTPYRTSGNTAKIYVPSAMIATYQTANNWSTLYGSNSNVFKAIEGSYYETHYADGTTIPSS